MFLFNIFIGHTFMVKIQAGNRQVQLGGSA